MSRLFIKVQETERQSRSVLLGGVGQWITSYCTVAGTLSVCSRGGINLLIWYLVSGMFSLMAAGIRGERLDELGDFLGHFVFCIFQYIYVAWC